MNRLPVPTERAVRAAKTVMVVVVLASVAWLIVQMLAVTADNARLEGRANEATAARAALADTAAAQGVALAKANNRLIRAGEDPVANPEPGPQGTAGSQGLQGLPGLSGPPGPVGPRGEDGTTGGTGRDGATGVRGGVGAPGVDGDPGTAGSDGTNGQQGANGQQGDRGPDGPQGERGEPGPPGPDGPPGPTGPVGPGGVSAYPFTFAFTVDTLPTAQTFTVTCTAPGACTVAKS